jgi:hypothetical protein
VKSPGPDELLQQSREFVGLSRLAGTLCHLKKSLLIGAPALLIEQTLIGELVFEGYGVSLEAASGATPSCEWKRSTILNLLINNQFIEFVNPVTGSGVYEQSLRVAAVYYLKAALEPTDLHVQIIQVDYIQRSSGLPDLCRLSIFLDGFQDIDILYPALGTNSCTKN